jgi:two-component system sensor histidine kinase BarA
MRLNWGIKTQVLLITFVPVIAISIFLGSYFTGNLLQNMQDSLWKNGVATALELAFSAEQGVFYGYPDILQQATDKAVNQEDIHAAAIFDKNGRLLAHTGNKLTLPDKETLESITDSFTTIDTQKSVRFIAPITLQDVLINEKDDSINNVTKQTIGWVCVEVARSTITEKRLHVLGTSFFIVLLGLLITYLFAVRLGRNVTNPILVLAKALDKIRKGILDTRVNVNAQGELRILQLGVNAMAQALEENHERMQKNIANATQELRNTLNTIENQNAELIIARREALTASQVKSDFLANMSHEIRTPMNGILGFISLLLESDLNTLQKEYLEIVHQSANSLLKILNDILDLSKFEAGKFDLEHISFDIRKAIKESLLILSANANAKNIQIISHVNSDVPQKMKGDPFRLKQIITNLVSNAIKFTEEGSITLHCKLEHENDDQLFLRINITDTGPGLRKEEQVKLFQAFSQADASITRRHGGTGLGLVICKKIVSQMNGNIGIESEFGQGATFWFTLTLEKDFSEDIEDEPLIIQKSLSNTLFNPSIKVLAVDDNIANIRLVSALLKELNVSVSIAHDGFDALEIASNEAFSLILMDIQMPGLDGVATTQRIQKESKYNKTTPIIALTALSTEKEQQSFLENGMIDCLTKPIDVKKLKEMVEKWVFQKEKTNESSINAETKKQLPIIDWKLAEKLAGNKPDLAREMIDMLMESLPEDKRVISSAVNNNDIEALKSRVHRLHGGCCYCGVPQLKDIAHRFETSLKQTNIINHSLYLELIAAIDNVLAIKLPIT